MQRTRRQIVDHVLRFKGELGDDDARELVEQLLNEAVETISLKHAFQSLILPAQYTFVSVANQRSYVLPDYFQRLPPRARIQNVTTGRSLELVTLDDLRNLDPAQGTSLEAAGSPEFVAFGGTQGVHTQPSSSGEACEVVSDAAGDIDVNVTVEGYNDDGKWQSIQVTLTGTVAVAVGTWTQIVNFAKAFQEDVDASGDGLSSRGTVTLRTTALVELETLADLESAKEHQLLTLYRMPSTAGDTYGVPVLRKPKKLVNDADEVPRNWGPAVFEEMRILYDVSTGEMTEADAARLPRLRFLDLLALDQTTKARQGVRRFQG